MATEATIRDLNSRQATVDYQRKQLLIRNYETERGIYENISGGDESVAYGQLLGKVDGADEWVVCKSAAIDGSQVPKGVYAGDAIVDAAAASQVDPVVVCIKGDLDARYLVFDGTDTLDTMVTGSSGEQKSMREWLKTASLGIQALGVTDTSEYDN